MQQFLYRIQPTRRNMLMTGPTEQEAQIVAAHFAYLQEHLGRGTVLMAGRTLHNDERTFGIVVLLAETEEQAAEFMQNDPAVKGGVMQGELYPYRIVLWSTEVPNPPGS